LSTLHVILAIGGAKIELLSPGSPNPRVTLGLKGYRRVEPLAKFSTPCVLHLSPRVSLGFWPQVGLVFRNKNAQNPAFLLQNVTKKFW